MAPAPVIPFEQISVQAPTGTGFVPAQVPAQAQVPAPASAGTGFVPAQAPAAVPAQGTVQPILLPVAEAGTALAAPAAAPTSNPRQINAGAAGHAAADPITWGLGAALLAGVGLLARTALTARRARTK